MPKKPISYRRTNKVKGWVNFPVKSKRYKSSGEGGMFVRLVVLEKKYNDKDRFVVCCGGHQSFSYDEQYLRDDNRTRPSSTKAYRKRYNDLLKKAGDGKIGHKKYRQEMGKLDKEEDKYDEYHFPRLGMRFRHDKNQDQFYRYQSTNYVCVMTVGSTGWSNGSWRCQFKDLTPEGKALYKMMKKLYRGHAIHLQTWLDT